MKIKLKAGEALESFGNYQGFSKDIWKKLNAGQVVEVDKIPLKAIKEVEEIAIKASKPKKIEKAATSTTKPKQKKKEVSNGK